MSLVSVQKGLVPAIRRGLALQTAPPSAGVLSATALRAPNNITLATPTTHARSFIQSSAGSSPNASILGLAGPGSPGLATSYFQKPSLPANTIIRFVPQQTAWIVERMGKYNRILEPGLAVLIPFIDRIAYVKSLKENASEIPSQSAITADNVTLELDGVLYTRVFDAYKARYAFWSTPPTSLRVFADRFRIATELKMLSTPSPSSRRPPCAAKSAN